MNNTVRTVVIMIVAAVWAINFTAPVFVSDYKPSPELNVAFMAIIGVLTASYKMEKNNTPEQKPPQEPQKLPPPENKQEDDPK